MREPAKCYYQLQPVQRGNFKSTCISAIRNAEFNQSIFIRHLTAASPQDTFLKELFIIWLCWVFIPACRLSLVAESRSSLHCSAQVTLCGAFSYCEARALVQAQQLWCVGLALPQHVGSSWTKDCAHVPLHWQVDS